MLILPMLPKCQFNHLHSVRLIQMSGYLHILTSLTDSGQVCTASTRVYVEKSASLEFQGLLADGLKKLKQGLPSNDDTELGPQADSVQAANISKFLEIGKQDGQVLAGGEPAKDIGANFIQPTIFTGIKDTSDVNQLEIFGPVLVLHEFQSEEEVIVRANSSECKSGYSFFPTISNADTHLLDGLYASVFSNNINKALRVAKALDAGSVGVNVASPYGAYELPFGGFKASGIGRQKGSRAVEAWTQEKTLYIQHNW